MGTILNLPCSHPILQEIQDARSDIQPSSLSSLSAWPSSSNITQSTDPREKSKTKLCFLLHIAPTNTT